jgi:hypothetical protein
LPRAKLAQGVVYGVLHRVGPVSLKGDEYRKKAEEADTLAGKTRDLRAADTYHNVADQYRALADYADRQDRSVRRN